MHIHVGKYIDFWKQRKYAERSGLGPDQWPLLLLYFWPLWKSPNMQLYKPGYYIVTYAMSNNSALELLNPLLVHWVE